VLGAGFACVPRGPGGTLVQHIRLADAGEVHRAVGQVRTIARDAGQTHAVWWVGELATPDDVVDWLTAEGLVPDEDEPLLASLVLREPPRGVAPNLEVTRVGTLDDFLVVQEIDLITMGVAPEQRISMAERSRARWDTVHDEGIVQTYLGRVDGRAVAFARSAYGTDGVALLGGGTLEPERGNGYYTALVHARWQDAVERGTPLLCTQAGKMSQPILERLGFEWLGAIRLLVDRL
jgi:predicted GNAT family acetyltransferase